MSDSENESRTTAVGRKRNLHGELKSHSYPTSRPSSRASSKESGEISSSSGSESDGEVKEDAPNKRFRHSPDDAITISSSSEDGEISESPARDSDMDVSSDSESASDDDDSDDSTSSHGISKMAGEADDMVRIRDLSNPDRAQQKLYFNLTTPEELVYCLCCGERGHMRATCPARKCVHCGSFENHVSSACRKYRKCGLCRQRSHDAKTCKNKSVRDPNDACDVCGEKGHIEEACSRLWCFPTLPQNLPPEKKIPAAAMLIACYACGSGEHWGDDCRFVRREDLNSNRTWSAKNAERFVRRLEEAVVESAAPTVEQDDGEDSDPLAALESGLEHGNGEYVEAEDSEEEYEPPPPPPPAAGRPWQMGLFDDARD